LCTGVVSLVLVAGTTSLYSIDTTTTGTTYVFSTMFYVVAVVSAALSIAEVLLLRAAFHRLASVDPRFSTPSKLALLLIIGFLILLIGLVPLIAGAQSISGCVANNTNSTLSGNCAGIADLLVGTLVVLAGGIVALIGYLGCLIGIWRFGSRYQNDLFKAGAILLIIPLLSVVGALLILIAARAERNRAGSTGMPGVPHF
jgi:cytochrome bd-type quinol oxidase subunit 2